MLRSHFGDIFLSPGKTKAVTAITRTFGKERAMVFLTSIPFISTKMLSAGESLQGEIYGD